MECLRSQADDSSKCFNSYNTRMTGAECFIALCQLTEILGSLLPLVYDIRPHEGSSKMKSVAMVEAQLQEWESGLPSWLNPSSPLFESDLPGALNLHLSFLAVKLCLCRVSLLVSLAASSSYLVTVALGECTDRNIRRLRNGLGQKDQVPINYTRAVVKM